MNPNPLGSNGPDISPDVPQLPEITIKLNPNGTIGWQFKGEVIVILGMVETFKIELMDKFVKNKYALTERKVMPANPSGIILPGKPT